jgi:hypothetical protein
MRNVHFSVLHNRKLLCFIQNSEVCKVKIMWVSCSVWRKTRNAYIIMIEKRFTKRSLGKITEVMGR